MKTCSKCGFVGDKSLFTKKRNVCKPCIKEYHKEYQIKNKDKIKDIKKEYGIKNKDEIKRRIQDYQNKNKKKIKEYHKEYNIKNKYEIKDVYVKHLIKGIKSEDISPELIEMKRIEIAMKRELKNK